MKYEVLSEEEQAQILRGRILQAEADHFNLLVNSKVEESADFSDEAKAQTEEALAKSAEVVSALKEIKGDVGVSEAAIDEAISKEEK